MLHKCVHAQKDRGPWHTLHLWQPLCCCPATKNCWPDVQAFCCGIKMADPSHMPTRVLWAAGLMLLVGWLNSTGQNYFFCWNKLHLHYGNNLTSKALVVQFSPEKYLFLCHLYHHFTFEASI